jgi:hypothetical protein
MHFLFFIFLVKKKIDYRRAFKEKKFPLNKIKKEQKQLKEFYKNSHKIKINTIILIGSYFFVGYSYGRNKKLN